MSSIRVGMGYDVHAFVDGRVLVLGGVEFPFPKGLAGHSDADVLVHALMDAILSAMRVGDIGELFPDTDSSFAGASSIGLLRIVASRMAAEGWTLVDADCVLVLEAPMISPHRDAMRSTVAGALGVDIEFVGIKATTTEGLGAMGRGEGIAAYAVVLLERVVA